MVSIRSSAVVVVVESGNKFKVLGLPVCIHKDYLGALKQRLLERNGTHVVTLNAEMVMQARKNPELAVAIAQADLVIPDGAGVVLYARSQGKDIDRCPGIELAESLINLSRQTQQQTEQQTQQQNQWRVFLLGGAVGITEDVARLWQDKFPGVAIAGTQHGYFDAKEEQILCEQIGHIQPEIILVGLGVPRQEIWIHKYRHISPHSTWIGVGGSFDVWAGLKTRAPRWLRDNHLEWVYRLYQEPWRWRRMLALPHFAWCVTCQAVRGLVLKKV